jgi:rubrerythrin
MKTAKQFVKELEQGNEALFKASAMQVKAYFESEPSQAELVDHFTGRMVNERMNLVEISRAISEMPATTSVKELQLLSRQASDEAKHFKMVKEVIEHITGEEVDLQAAVDSWETRVKNKGASLINEFDAHNDGIAMALYQMCAEGRAEAVWNQMAETIKDEFISTRYAEIARDEGFHSKIGAWKLEQLVETPEAQAHAAELVAKMRKELYRISCAGTKYVPEAKQLMEQAYDMEIAIA